MSGAAEADRILLVRLSAVGDCVHALPAVAALRAARPGAHLAWAIDDRAAPLLAGHPDVDEFLVMPRRALKNKPRLERWRMLTAYRRALRTGRFDAAVDFQGLARSALVAFFSGARLRIGPARGLGARELSWLFYNSTPPVPEGARHIAEKSRALLAPLGAPADLPLPAPRIPEHPGAAERVAAALEGAGLAAAPFAVLNPGAGWATKLWPAEHYARLCGPLREELGLEVLVAWFGPAERALAERIAGAGPARLAPPTDLQELAELLRRAALYVGGDTGPTHIAAAAGAPTVALYGASDAGRNSPLGPALEVLTAGLDCSPCWRRQGCPRALECMRAIRPAGVLDAARRLVSRGGREAGR